ncbi:MAG: class B sortase, partial [Vallitaleaceae bacterium]|nr:class B sortase [Vallitaleaceae bacterium]
MSARLRKIRPLVFFVLFLSLIVMLQKEDEPYPRMQNMEEFRRSFFHDGESFLSSSFQETIIKSAIIVKAQLSSHEVTDENYVIYTFQIRDSIKNPHEDAFVYVYEPITTNQGLLYEYNKDYVLMLSRTDDLYERHPISFNFGFIRIPLDRDKQLDQASAQNGSIDLRSDYKIYTYEDLKEYVAQVRRDNKIMKDGIYDYHGRFIDSEEPFDLVQAADYIVEITLEEVLHTNRLLQESRFRVDKDYTLSTAERIIISVPTYHKLQVGEKYLALLYKDANYTLVSRAAFLPQSESSLYSVYQELITDRIAEQTPEEFVLSEEEALLSEIEVAPDLPIEREYIINPIYQSYYDINDDVVGWIKIDDTVIDYPILQGEDNSYYLKHDINGNEYFYGSILLDFRCDIKNITRNTMVYGHNMKKN